MGNGESGQGIASGERQWGNENYIYVIRPLNSMFVDMQDIYNHKGNYSRTKIKSLCYIFGEGLPSYMRLIIS